MLRSPSNILLFVDIFFRLVIVIVTCFGGTNKQTKKTLEQCAKTVLTHCECMAESGSVSYSVFADDSPLTVVPPFNNNNRKGHMWIHFIHFMGNNKCVESNFVGSVCRMVSFRSYVFIFRLDSIFLSHLSYPSLSQDSK